MLDWLVEADVKAAVESLPETFRIPVLLADLEGFAYKEIAEILDIPIGTVMSRLHAARLRLRAAADLDENGTLEVLAAGYHETEGVLLEVRSGSAGAPAALPGRPPAPAVGPTVPVICPGTGRRPARASQTGADAYNLSGNPAGDASVRVGHPNPNPPRRGPNEP
mgnify:CR=1 FL=1